jgi:hypothetical protein
MFSLTNFSNKSRGYASLARKICTAYDNLTHLATC